MTKERFKDALIAILIGAIAAFLTALMEGLGELLNGYFPNLAAAVVAAAKYGLRYMV